MRLTWIFVVFLGLLPAFLSSCSGMNNSTRSSTTFVQIPDVHLFDDSKRRPEDELWKQDEQAFKWALHEIGKIKDLKFVVFSGDLGLEMTGPFWERYAVNYFANDTELSKLDVQYILFVPGNNDLLNEEPADIKRYRSFVTALGNALGKAGNKAKVVDLSESFVDIDNMRIHGLNSATFKNSIPCRLDFSNKQISTPVPDGWTVVPFGTSPEIPVQSLWCKNADILERLHHQANEMVRLSKEVNDAPNKVHLVFTHIPPLPDPFADAKGPPAWNLAPATADIWKEVMPRINCMFAAHFHTNDIKHYGGIDSRPLGINDSSVKPCDKDVVVAPPLAIKFQENKERTARGFLEGTVKHDGKISYSIRWFSKDDQSN